MFARHSVEFEGVFGSKFERNVTKFLPHKVLKLIARSKLTFDDDLVELHRVASYRFTKTSYL